MMRRGWPLVALATAVIQMAAAERAFAQRPKIMLTGYWPPSNEALRQFSTDPVLNPNGWAGSNWEGRGYDIHSFFPTFSPATCTSCGVGMGQLKVDYQDTTQDFWAIADSLQPAAIITFSRGFPGVSWEVEMNQFNRSVWIQDFVPPLTPTPSPPDASVPAGFLRQSTLPVQNIVNGILAANVPVNPGICATADGGGFLSEFIAYLGVWYQSIHEWPDDPAWCAAAGHIHVGTQVTWPLAIQAAEVTLRELTVHLDGIRATTVCQQDLGFQGPGSAALQACGGQLGYAGNTADVRVTDALPQTVGVLALGAQSNPTPLFAGTAVPLPAFFVETIVFDADGSWLAEGLLQAPPMPMPDVFAQVAYLDASLPEGFGLSNALRIVLQ
ncbi:MAG: hypothetical protein AB8H80_14950 [Planctomycetota bacterium]